jgi:hypothetical protein
VRGAGTRQQAHAVGGDALRRLTASGIQPVASHGTSSGPTVSAPSGASRVQVTAPSRSDLATGVPNIGQTKTFPNGRKAIFDGTGWLAVDQPDEDNNDDNENDNED